ncbi:hypothetical protein [Photorhabdus khanii]|nr:hypothetical protein [Photorhabdus khanii]
MANFKQFVNYRYQHYVLSYNLSAILLADFPLLLNVVYTPC